MRKWWSDGRYDVRNTLPCSEVTTGSFLLPFAQNFFGWHIHRPLFYERLVLCLLNCFFLRKLIFTVFVMHFVIFLNFALLLVAFATASPQETITCTEELTATTSSAAIRSPSSPYSVVSALSESPIHLLPMQARKQNFYLGGLPGAYCPQPPVSSCPSGVATIFVGLGALVSLCS